ncbi:MAG: PhzF family phenazine biosynthesis protein [Acidimicrobiales bacterium]
MPRRFSQIDVFTRIAYRGNPVAVVHDADDLDEATMRGFAHWTNLSETTFLLAPTDPAADYRVRIFTPAGELPFAGHPTLGTCHAWLEAGGAPAHDGVVVQQCEAGLVTVRRGDDGLAFAAPPLVRSGPVDGELRGEIADVLGIGVDELVDAAWADNGPGWIAVLLRDADAVLAVSVGSTERKIGVVGPYPPGHEAQFEVRAFFPTNGVVLEDPVTGSLNASIAMWLLGTGRASAPYVASQGAAVGRAGRVRVERDPDGTIWVGGGTVTCVSGTVDLSSGLSIGG